MKYPNALRPAAIGRFAVTMVVVVAAIYAGTKLWDHYEVEPWTRDGRVKANVVQVAPDVSGLVAEIPVRDNQDVKAGDVLVVLDGARFDLALTQARTSVETAEVARRQAERDLKRNRGLGDLVSTEIREQSQTKLEQAQASLEQARVAVQAAQLNLDRSRILAPADGRVTNLDLRVGSYVTAGRGVLALVETQTFYVEGYFEETKLPSIQVGDSVDVTLMGESRVIRGHVDSIALGITDRDRSTGSNLLPNVNPTFNWVRLAQRIPVRVAIDHVPDGVRLVAGQTATVAVVGTAAHDDTRTSAATQADRPAKGGAQ